METETYATDVIKHDAPGDNNSEANVPGGAFPIAESFPKLRKRRKAK